MPRGSELRHACTHTPPSELVGSAPSRAAPGKEQSWSPIQGGAGLPGTLCFRERPRRTGQENQVAEGWASSSPLDSPPPAGRRPDPTDVVTNNAVGLWQQASRTQRSPDEKPPTPTQPGLDSSIKQHASKAAASETD